MTTKTPEQTLQELDRIAKQAVKDAEIVREYISLQARLESKSERAEGKQEEVKGEPQATLFNQPKKRGTGKTAVISALQELNRWAKFREIVEATKKYAPKLEPEILERIVRDTLSKDGKRKKPVIDSKKASDSGRDLVYRLKKEAA